MRYIDRPFASAVGSLLLGGILGTFVVIMVPPVRGPVLGLIEARLVNPIKAVSQFGNVALLLLIFMNNSIPCVLSFTYAVIIAKANWTPPLTQEKRWLLLSCFTWLCAFLIGFFGLGVALAVGWLLGGTELFMELLRGAWIHGPIEIMLVLLCVSEPLRLARQDRAKLASSLRGDLRLLAMCLIVLLVSAAIEVFVKA